jgi:TRAP-type C4-dicarboxylate transport system permease small subunit
MRAQLVAVVHLEWLLRLAVAGAFVGHGAYGAVVAKSTWFSYFGALGIPESVVTANELMTLVGFAEIVAGVMTLVLPIPALIMVMAGWKIFSELLRPIAGEPAWEFVERASNMVAPLALVVVNRERTRLAKRRWHWYAIRPC